MASKPALKTVEQVLDGLPEPTLHSAMALAFAEIEGATKSATNPHFKSKYADLGAVIEAIKPALISHGLFFAQHCRPAEDGVSVETVLYHKSGENMSLGILYLPANKKDAQGFGSALTYARRYALVTAFGVPVEDDDGNQGTKSFNERKSPPTVITEAQLNQLRDLADKARVSAQQICKIYKIDGLPELPSDEFQNVKGSLERTIAEKANA